MTFVWGLNLCIRSKIFIKCIGGMHKWTMKVILILMYNFCANSVTVTQWAWREKLREVQLFQDFSNVEENARRKFYVLRNDCIDIFSDCNMCWGIS